MSSLVNVFGQIYMDIYDRDHSYPEVDVILTQLEHATPEVISHSLLEVDHAQGDENTPLMYAAIFHRTSWIRRMLRIASRAEEGVSGHAGIPDLRKHMFQAVNSVGESAIVLLVDAELVHAEEEHTEVELERIRLFVEHGTSPDQPIESRGITVRQYADQQGVHIDWNNGVGHLKRAKRKRTKRHKKK